MADIHYFQRYSKKENVVTNNTLLLLSRVYHYSPSICEDILNALLDDENLSIGPSFVQQEGGQSTRGTRSIPDGTISQPSFRVIIETKRHGVSSAGPLIRHLDQFRDADTQVLLLLDKHDPSDEIAEEVKAAVSGRNHGERRKAVFGSVTFTDLIEMARREIPSHAVEMVDVIDDYEEFCTNEGLIPSAPHKMRAVLCGTTLEENIRHGVYYHPADRGYSELGYLGLYKEKSVRAIGKLGNTAQARVSKEGNLELVDSDGALTEEEKQRIKAVATEGMENHEYGLNEKDHRYFLVDQFVRTDDKGDGEGFNKTSKYGLPGEKHFDLKDELGLEKNEPLPEETTEIARLLAGESWS